MSTTTTNAALPAAWLVETARRPMFGSIAEGDWQARTGYAGTSEGAAGARREARGPVGSHWRRQGLSVRVRFVAEGEA